MKAHQLPRQAKILKRRFLTEKIVALDLKISDKKPFSFHPGQFVILSIFGFGEVPIAIATSPKEKGPLQVAVRSVGVVTEKIFSLKEGDQIGITGPFGVGFPLSKIKGRDLVLIAGGLGLAPLRSLICHLEKSPGFVKSLIVLHGAHSSAGLLYQDEYEKWKGFASLSLAAEKPDCGFEGCVGGIDDLFDEVKIKRGSVIIACGPPKMYKTIADRYAAKAVSEDDLYFLLERRVKCAVGRCQHCVCGEQYVCLDGPILQYSKIKYENEVFL